MKRGSKGHKNVPPILLHPTPQPPLQPVSPPSSAVALMEPLLALHGKVFGVDFMCKYEKMSFYCHNASKFCENLLRIRSLVQ